MENQRQKWVNLVFTAVAILVAGVAFIALSKFTAIYNLESRVKQIDMVIRLGSLVLGAATGFGMYMSDQTNAFTNEVILEVSRVTWPSTKETTNATVWVVLFVLATGALLGALDSFWSWIVKMIL